MGGSQGQRARHPVHTDIESMPWALEEFFLPMLGANIAVGAHTAWRGFFPQRLPVIDELGTFASMAERMHRRQHSQGTPAALDRRCAPGMRWPGSSPVSSWSSRDW